MLILLLLLIVFALLFFFERLNEPLRFERLCERSYDFIMSSPRFNSLTPSLQHLLTRLTYSINCHQESRETQRLARLHLLCVQTETRWVEAGTRAAVLDEILSAHAEQIAVDAAAAKTKFDEIAEKYE